MASGYPFHMDHYLQQTLSVDNRRSFFDDDESILDENILDSNSTLLDSTLDCPPVDRRRGSGLESGAIFSPSGDWDFDTDMGLPAGPADDAAPATFEHSNGTNNPFVKLEQAQPASYAAQPHNWSANPTSGACTPTVYDNNAYAAGFDENGAYGASGFDNNNVHITPLAVFQSSAAVAASIPASPAVKDWNQAAPADHDGPMAKRMRAQSPGPRSHSPLHVVRRDGIRKKNARFDIPAERTLMNIDQLIARSQDENEIKELKQQKRLLRNRQAALDSRQRKKQHTERLEEEKKLHSAVIQELEEKIAQMTMNEEQYQQRLQTVVRERDHLHREAEGLQLEKEEMVRAHTIETGELRKKNAYLQDQLQKMQDALDRASVPHHQGGFSDAFGFDDDFSLDDNCWNDPMVDVVAPVTKTEKVSSDVEKPPTGLLLILLLCGAFVASQSGASTPAPLPPLPKSIQTASTSVLQNIFHDAGVTEVNRVEVVPTSTSESWAVAKSDVPRMVGLESSMSVINSFDKGATAEQQHEQLLQLTPAEYNEVTSNNFLREPEPVDSRGRRRIHENLAAMRNGKPSAAEVYTRSLLWDKVDAEVVRKFAAFARQVRSQQATGNNEGGGAECHS